MSTRSFPFPINSFEKNKHAVSPFPISIDTTPYRRPTSDPPPISPPTPVPPSPLIFFVVAHWITGRGRMLLKSWLQLSNIGAESSLTVMLLIWAGLGLRGGAATGEWARPRCIEFGWSLLDVPKKLLMRKIKSWIMENICSIN
ncbi:hypothetical protein KSS87_010161 [Heliosperma pusillum]|nr:hypothetical protein KSS87_010161 [Heliosperma pusillum]